MVFQLECHLSAEGGEVLLSLTGKFNREHYILYTPRIGISVCGAYIDCHFYYDALGGQLWERYENEKANGTGKKTNG